MKALMQHLQLALMATVEKVATVAILTTLGALCSHTALAHSFSNSYLNLSVNQHTIDGQLRLRLEDIVWLADLDQNRDQQLTWGELQAGTAAIHQAVATHLQLSSANERCPLQLSTMQLEQLNTGLYVVLPLQAQCAAAPQQLTVQYNALMTTDAAHRGILNLQHDSQVTTAVFAPTNTRADFDLGSTSANLSLLAMLQEGIWHIWTGYDHLLFLLALLLPLFLNHSSPQRWVAPAAAVVVKSVLWTVTAFTVAHSLTLLLSTVFDLQVASAKVETLIAISVALSGINILYPIFRSHAAIAFSFGLIHGLGFAGALRDLQLPTSAFVQSLLSFNLGVEVGQLTLVALLFPLMLYVRHQRYYQRLVQPLVALSIVGVGLAWAVERGMGL
jgi:hypothetical protein